MILIRAVLDRRVCEQGLETAVLGHGRRSEALRAVGTPRTWRDQPVELFGTRTGQWALCGPKRDLFELRRGAVWWHWHSD